MKLLQELGMVILVILAIVLLVGYYEMANIPVSC